MEQNSPYRILGIDPGTATTGFGIIDTTISKVSNVVDYGVITTEASLMDAKRLAIIDKSLKQLIINYKPNIIAIEKLFFFRNTTTIITVAQARGVILLNAELHNLQLFEFTPLQIKQALTGYGKAPKPQMQQMVATILRLKSIPKPDDAADGLAVALCCQSSLGYLLKT
ncbi:crossover junction endodeoxyribonuclease RuvC [bacterium]|nr:crossover junction endodeoxyribonuclease RuvC [Candidatus Elulimicrobium humile]